MSQLLYVGSFSANIDMTKALNTGFSLTEPSIAATHGAGISIYAVDETTGKLRSVDRLVSASEDSVPITTSPILKGTSCPPSPRPVMVPCSNPNPSFIALHPTNNNIFYATNEILDFQDQPTGAVSCYRSTVGGGVELINRVSSEGKIPCHIDVSTPAKFLATANYSEGNFTVYRVNEKDGSILNVIGVVQHGPEGTGVDKLRQSQAHAHQCRFHPSNPNILYVPDLGLDKVMCYFINEKTQSVDFIGALDCPLGSGPRHLDFHPSRPLLYVMCELDFSIVTAKILESGALEYVDIVYTLPKDLTHIDGWMGSTVKVSPDGKFLYGGMRGPHLLSINRIKQDTGALECIGHQKVGPMPRDFNISPAGDLITVGSQTGNFIQVYKVDKATGLLQLTQEIPCGSPVCFKFGPVPKDFVAL